MPTSSLPQKVKTSDNVLFQQIGNECVLLNMETEQYFGLDDVGARVWQIISEDGDTQKLVDTLKGEYDTDEGTLQHDLSQLFASLQKEALITLEV